MRRICFLALLVAVPQLIAQENPNAITDAPTYNVNRVGDAAPLIDGIISPGEWDAAATAAGGWVDLRTHQPDLHNLRFRALWDDERIYLLGETDFDEFPEGPSTQPASPNFGGGSYNPNFYFDPNTDDEVFLSEDWQVDGYQFTWDVFEGHAERRPTEGSPDQSLRDPLDEDGDFVNDYFYGVFLEAHANTAFGNNGLFDLSNDGPNGDYRDDNHPGFVLAQTADNFDLNGSGVGGGLWEVSITWETLNATDPNRLVTQEEADARPATVIDEREFIEVPDPEFPDETIEIDNPDFGVEAPNVGQLEGIPAFIGEAGTPDLRFSDPDSAVFLDNGLFAVEPPEPGDVWGFETSIITPDQANNFLPSWSEPADDGRVNNQDGDRNSFAPWGPVGHGRLIFAGGDAEPPALIGDIDGDGSVAFSDFLILSDAFGTTVEPGTTGDLDGDGNVAFSDFLLLSDNFGTTAAAASVPEPSAFCLLCLGILPMLRRKRR